MAQNTTIDLTLDATQVDQFGFQLMLNGTPGGSLQGAFNMGRAAIINQAGPTVPGTPGRRAFTT